MKKRVLFLLALMWAAIGFAQIPTEYSEEVQRSINVKYQTLLNEFDVVLKPIERMPVRPTSFSLATGNWGSTWTGATKYHDDIARAAKRKVAVFIIDTAPLFEHQYLDGFAWNELGKSFTGEDDLRDGQGHGTHVAGIIGARSELYELGVARALTEGGYLKGIPVESLNDDGAGNYSWITAGVYYCIEKGIELQRDGWFVIITMSLGGPGFNQELDLALKKAQDLGFFITVASGNTYKEGIEFPGRSKYVHAIGSIDSDGKRSNFSSWGNGLFMAAPGRSILSTYPGGSLVELSGTSMATPTQAALAAITASIYPTATAKDVERILVETATDIDPAGYDIETGNGYNYVGKILAYDFEPEEPPVEDPEEPEEPVEEVIKSRRAVTAVLPGPYKAIFQSGGGSFQDVELCNLVVSFKSKKYSKDALEEISTAVSGFFQNRAVTLLEQGDELRAGYWLGRFLEIHLKKQGIKAKFQNACVIDQNGNQGLPEWPRFFDHFRASRRTTFKY